MPRRELLPKGVSKVFDKEPDLYDQWSRHRPFDSSGLPELVRKIFSNVSYKELNDAEKFLTQFGEPVDVKGGFFRGHPNQGVFRKDQDGNRKYGLDFFRFSYGSKAESKVSFPKIAADLVPGAQKMNAVSANVKSLITKKRKLLDKIAERRRINAKKAKLVEKLGAKRASKIKIVEKKPKNVVGGKNPKKKGSNNQTDTNTKSLYWYDVFNKSSRESAL